MTRPLSAFCLLFLSVFPAFSADIFSDFLFIFPTPTASAELDFQVEFFERGPIKIQSADIKVSGQPIVSNRGTVIPQLKIQASALGLQYKDVVEIVDTNWSGRFSIEARCDFLDVSLVGEAVLNWDSVSNTYSVGSWVTDERLTTVHARNCAGVKGFEAYLEKALKRSHFVQGLLVENQGALLEWLKQQGRPYFDDWQAWGPLFWKMSKLEPKESQLQAQGQIYLKEKGEGTSYHRISQPVDVQQPALLVPKEFLKKWLQVWLLDQTGNFSWQSSDVPAFKSLMRSRFMQFFVWPELMRFPKSTNFHFELKKFDILDLQTPQQNRMNVLATIEGEIVTDSGVKYLKLKWNMPILLDLSSHQEKINIKVLGVHQNPEIGLADGYQLKYSSRIPKSSIIKAIKEQIENKSWDFSLPSQLVKNVEFEKLDIQDELAKFLFKIKF